MVCGYHLDNIEKKKKKKKIKKKKKKSNSVNGSMSDGKTKKL